MQNNCSNCEGSITLNYCHNCGQKKYRRIDRKYILEEIQYTLLHINKGFLYSIKCLLQNPGKTAWEYINGRRVNHYKPILMAVVLSSLYGFLATYFLDIEQIVTAHMKSQNIENPAAMQTISAALHYQNIITLLLVPFFAMITRFFFREQAENYFEHIIMNAYLQSTFSLAYTLLFCPIAYMLKGNPENFMSFSNLFFLAYPCILIWFFRTYYTNLTIGKIVFKVFMMFAFAIVLMLVFGIALALMSQK